jgi:5S rRNA maturation endonuclease (ribonuclease M5)
MNRPRRHGSLGTQERLELLEKAVDLLRETAEAGTVVVEGVRDVAALEWLGIGGLHVKLHQGRPLPAVLEDLAQSPPPVVLLVDWDRKGGQLLSLLEENLRARVQVDIACRRRIASVTRARCLEEVPAELEALRLSS